MTAKQQRSRTRLDSIGLSPDEENGLRDLGNDTLLRNGCRQQWAKKTEEEQEAWFIDLAQVVKQCGLDRVRAGMETAWTHMGNLPSAPDVRKHLPPEPAEARPRSTYHLDCADCCGTGWKWVMVYSKFLQRDEPRMDRCHCNYRPYTTRKVADEADIAAMRAAWHALVQTFSTKTKTFYPRVIPIVPFTADQIQQRKPMERAECDRVRQQFEVLEAQANGNYEKQA